MWFRYLALLFVVIAACSGAPEPGATGAEIYRQVCANCHATDLSGGIGPPVGEGSVSVSLPDDYLRLTIREGRGAMPAFSRTLTEDQIERVIGYLRERQRG
jgi:cytochrome c551